MDGDTDFYVYLISDGSSHVYPANKVSAFKILLPRPLRLNKTYRVGLKQIHFPTDIEDHHGFKLLGPTQYLNSLLPVKLNRKYEAKEIVSAEVPDAELQDLQESRTASSTSHQQEQQQQENEDVPQDFGKQLYIYTDIIQPVAVASDFISLLSVVPFTSTGLFEPQHPVFHKLIGQEIQTISIWIRDHLSRPVKFRNGRVIILLHFISV